MSKQLRLLKLGQTTFTNYWTIKMKFGQLISIDDQLKNFTTELSQIIGQLRFLLKVIQDATAPIKENTFR